MAKAKKVRKSAKKAGKAKTAFSNFDAGAMIRKARESANISQEELALRLKSKRTAISRIENHAEDIKLSTLERVAKALGKELKIKLG